MEKQCFVKSCDEETTVGKNSFYSCEDHEEIWAKEVGLI